MRHLVFALGVASLAIPQAASAAVFAFSYSGSGTSGQGTFTTDDVNQTVNGRTAQRVTGISGTVDNVAITSLIAPGGYDNNDNYLFATSPYVDAFGISFNYGSNNRANLYRNSSGTFYVVTNSNARTETLIGLSVTAVPEPATWLMMIAGFGLIGMTARRRRASIRFA